MKLDVTFSEPEEMNAGFGEIQVIGGGGGVTEEQLAETLEEAKSYTDEVTASFSDDIEILNTRVDALGDTCTAVENNDYGFMMAEEFTMFLDENMEHITESVIASLPIYDGEVV